MHVRLSQWNRRLLEGRLSASAGRAEPAWFRGTIKRSAFTVLSGAPPVIMQIGTTDSQWAGNIAMIHWRQTNLSKPFQVEPERLFADLRNLINALARLRRSICSISAIWLSVMWKHLLSIAATILSVSSKYFLVDLGLSGFSFLSLSSPIFMIALISSFVRVS